MTKKIKTIISAVVAAAMVSAGTVTAYAAPENTAPETVETEISESTTTTAADNTMSAPETTSANTTVNTTPAETSAPVTEPITQPTTTTTTKLENPFETGMLADDELYSFIMGYLDEGVEFDIDGTGVLVDESVIRGYEENSAFSENEDGEDESSASGYIKGSSEKIMYTVVTRDGSMFYIVIDKAKSGENVYFLNNVDIVDLASVINRQAEVDEDGNAVLSRQERDIVNEASNVSITTSPMQRPNDESGSGSQDGEDDSEVNDENSDNEDDEESTGGRSMTLYLIIGVAAVAVIGFAWYKKMGPGSQKTKAAFTEDEDEEEAEEETVTEEDDDIPLEDDYEEE